MFYQIPQLKSHVTSPYGNNLHHKENTRHAKDWDSIARKEKIEGFKLELRKLEGAVNSIHQNLLYLKGREAEMRTVSEKTNGRVAWFSIMSLVMCIAVSGLQLWYLKRYFQKKNLYRLFNFILFVIQQTYNNLVKFL
ncbi:Transmembrane emp24 domain-containing protein p24delta4 [Glycine soja]